VSDIVITHPARVWDAWSRSFVRVTVIGETPMRYRVRYEEIFTPERIRALAGDVRLVPKHAVTFDCYSCRGEPALAYGWRVNDVPVGLCPRCDAEWRRDAPDGTGWRRLATEAAPHPTPTRPQPTGTPRRQRT
jgi:hypothetical protein